MIHCDISAVCDIAEVIPRSFKEGMQIFDSGAKPISWYSTAILSKTFCGIMLTL
jgi:hypothetical protein